MNKISFCERSPSHFMRKAKLCAKKPNNIKISAKSTYQFGSISEKLARIFLTLKGYKILTHNYKSKFGEIDIIASKAQTIIFIEVKARKQDELIETILRKKQLNRIKNAAEFFIAQNPEYQNFDIRFDFILFRESNFPEHHKNYF